MEWKRHTKTDETANELASSAGMKNTDVRSLVTSLDTYAVVTWTTHARLWEAWEREVGEQWCHLKGFTSAGAAKDYCAAQESERLVLEKVRAMPDGALVVVAEWREPYSGSRPLRFPCSSPATAEGIASIMKRLGCSVTTEIAA